MMLTSAVTFILSFVIALAILVLVHEFGHYIVAKLAGVRVEIFSIGFGKRLFGFKKGDTDYRVCAIPLGGYVKLTGQGYFEELTGEPYELASKPGWIKFLVMFAGSGMNALFAIFCLAIFYMMGTDIPAYFTQKPVLGWVREESLANRVGLQRGDLILEMQNKKVDSWMEVEEQLYFYNYKKPLSLTVQRNGRKIQTEIDYKDPQTQLLGLDPPLEPQISQVVKDSPAEKSGLSPGDVVLAVNDTPIGDFHELSRFVSKSDGIPLKLNVKRNTQEMEVEVKPEKLPDSERPLIGVYPAHPTVRKRFSPIKALELGSKQSALIIGSIGIVLSRLVVGQESVNNLSGPLHIAAIAGEKAKEGIGPFLEFLAVLSLNLAFFNLLPIPVLDGGHILFLFIEPFIKKSKRQNVKEKALQIGFLFILLLIVFILVNDVRVHVLPRIMDSMGW